LLAGYGDWAERDLTLLREAAIASDELAALRSAIANEGGPAQATQRLLRLEHQAFVRLTKALAALRLED
jgi:hypothetical protein